MNLPIAHQTTLKPLTIPASGTVSWTGVVRGGRLSVYVSLTGTGTGVFKLQTSFDGGVSWIDTPGASSEISAQPAGAAFSALWNWANVPGTNWRVLYTATSGAGTATGYAAQGV
jgi:hypothetical protein